MSEAEKKRRLAYKQNRQKWILIQIAAIALIALLAIFMFASYRSANKTYYIAYSEHGSLDYKVQLKNNDFFEEEWLGQDRVYIASLINTITAVYQYELQMSSDDVLFDYSYQVDANLSVVDKNTGISLYSPTESLFNKQTKENKGGGKVQISVPVAIDFHKFNEHAKDFIAAYQLKDVTSVLKVKLTVNVTSRSEQFAENNQDSYTSELQIPLNEDKINIKSVSTALGEDKVLLCSDTSALGYMIGTIIAGSIDVILLGLLIAFIYLTRNTDINYAIKVKRLVSAYRSYIQKIDNAFDSEGYQLLFVNSFKEMLGIRDTIHSPILMTENEDCTCTQFLIPTNTKILYIFEIKVDDYDQIYNPEPVILEDVDDEALAEALDAPDVDLDAIDFVPDDDQEEDEGVEVVGVVWPEKANKNKVYRYDPNGEALENGDVVLVPSRDVHKNKDIIRKAAVAHGNHKVAPDTLRHPLKKIIGVVKRKAEDALTPNTKE